MTEKLIKFGKELLPNKDPTRTASMIQKVEDEIKRRYSDLTKKVLQKIEKENVVGLTGESIILNDASGRVSDFIKWFDSEAQKTLEESAGGKSILGSYYRRSIEGGAKVTRSMLEKIVGTANGKYLTPELGKTIIPKEVADLKVEALKQGLNAIDDKLRGEIQTILSDSLVRGDSPRAAAKKIEERLDISESAARRYARTEILKAHNLGAVIEARQPNE